MENQIEDYRIAFCGCTYEILQDDADNARANAIIDLYDILFEVTEHLERENFEMKMTIKNLQERLNKLRDY